MLSLVYLSLIILWSCLHSCSLLVLSLIPLIPPNLDSLFTFSSCSSLFFFFFFFFLSFFFFFFFFLLPSSFFFLCCHVDIILLVIIFAHWARPNGGLPRVLYFYLQQGSSWKDRHACVSRAAMTWQWPLSLSHVSAWELDKMSGRLTHETVSAWGPDKIWARLVRWSRRMIERNNPFFRLETRPKHIYICILIQRCHGRKAEFVLWLWKDGQSCCREESQSNQQSRDWLVVTNKQSQRQALSVPRASHSLFLLSINFPLQITQYCPPLC